MKLCFSARSVHSIIGAMANFLFIIDYLSTYFWLDELALPAELYITS
jgi:hypothetical protein